MKAQIILCLLTLKENHIWNICFAATLLDIIKGNAKRVMPSLFICLFFCSVADMTNKSNTKKKIEVSFTKS